MSFEQIVLSACCTAVAALFALFRLDTLSTRKKLEARDGERERERKEWDKQRALLWKSMRRLENRVAVVDVCPVVQCPAQIAIARMKLREDQEDKEKN